MCVIEVLTGAQQTAGVHVTLL